MFKKESTRISRVTLTLITVYMIFAAGIYSVKFQFAESKEAISSLEEIGNKIGGIDFNSGVWFGNLETCDDSTTCIGSNGDDIIHGGAREQVFGKDGDDMIFGGLSSQLYGGKEDDIILPGPGNNVADGESGDDALFGGIGNDLLNGGKGSDKLFAGTGDTIMKGGSGANHFDCPLSLLGLARAIVLDYNPDNGDTIAGQCKVINTVIGDDGDGDVPKIDLPNSDLFIEHR